MVERFSPMYTECEIKNARLVMLKGLNISVLPRLKTVPYRSIAETPEFCRILAFQKHSMLAKIVGLMHKFSPNKQKLSANVISRKTRELSQLLLLDR